MPGEDAVSCLPVGRHLRRYFDSAQMKSSSCPAHRQLFKCLINALTGHVGTGTKMSGNRTNQELAEAEDRGKTLSSRELAPASHATKEPIKKAPRLSRGAR